MDSISSFNDLSSIFFGIDKMLEITFDWSIVLIFRIGQLYACIKANSQNRNLTNLLKFFVSTFLTKITSQLSFVTFFSLVFDK